MTMLDTRAREAANAVQQSVSDYVPPAPIPVLAKTSAMWRGLGYALAGAGAVALFALIALLTVPTLESNVTDTTSPTAPPTTVAITIPPTTVPDAPVTPLGPPESEPAVTVPPPVTETTATTSTTLPADTTPPGISVTSPADGTHFETELVTFIGTTEPGAGVVAGGTYAAYVDADGVWSIQLVLAPGPNGATFVATDEAGNQSVAKLVVHLDVPEEAPPGEKPPPPTSFEFTANQTYGSCEENPPYDVFYGTADPHTPVSISSPYGGGTVKSDAEGNWELRVTFPEAPFEKTFEVKVKDHTGAKQVFAFTSYFSG
jgi:hypothetical protein